MTDQPAAEDRIARKWQQLTAISPYSRELGQGLHSVDPDWCVIKVPYDTRLVGNPRTRVLHGGAVTALLDSCYELAIFVRMNQLRSMATLDLRIDYLKPATPGRDLFGGAVCYKVSADLAFVRGCAYHDTPDDPVATSVAIFIFTGGPAISLEGEVPT